MATIQCFEDLFSWKEARELNLIVGNMIDSGRFKNNYRLINQIEGAAGSIMDNIAEGFGRAVTKSLCNFFISRKDLVLNSDLNYIEPLTENILQTKNLISSVTRLKRSVA